MPKPKQAVAMDVTTSKLRQGANDVDPELVDRLAKDKNPMTKTTLDKKMKKAEENREKIIEETKEKAKEEVEKAKKVAKKVENARKKGKSSPSENNIESKDLLKRTQMPVSKSKKK